MHLLILLHLKRFFIPVCPDDRLVSILRHHSFLKELQEIALQGGSPLRGGRLGDRSHLQLSFISLSGGQERADTAHVTPQTSEAVSDVPGEGLPFQRCFYPHSTSCR